VCVSVCALCVCVCQCVGVCVCVCQCVSVCVCVCVSVCQCVSVCVCVCVYVCVCTYICIYICYTGAEESNSRLYVGLWQPSGNEPAKQPMVVRGGGGSDGSFRLSSSGALLHRGQAHDLSLPHTNIHIDPPSASAEPGAFLRAVF